MSTDLNEIEDLIASWLSQKGECRTPFGVFTIATQNGYTDIAAREVAALQLTCKFQEGDYNFTPEFTDYISRHLNCTREEAIHQSEVWMAEIRNKLDQKDPVNITGMGSLYKDSDGNIRFRNSETIPLFPNIPADRVIREEEVHKVLVGEKESDSTQMMQLLNETQPGPKSKWWIAAVVLFFVSIILYFLNSTGVLPTPLLHSEEAQSTYISK